MKQAVGLCAVVFVVLFLASPVLGEVAAGDSLVEVVLNDGTKLVGIVMQQDSTGITIETTGGLMIEVPQDKIASIKPASGKIRGGGYYDGDPNYSRLLTAPSGRPMRKGEGYFSDTWLLFPAVAYGLTDEVSILAGVSMIPGVSLGDQLFYISPRIGKQITRRAAVSAGFIYATIPDEGAIGMALIAGSWGDADSYLSAGLGIGFFKDGDGGFEFDERPVVLIGGNLRLSRTIALVSENWIYWGTDAFDESFVPVGIAVRIFGKHLAADVGVILIKEALEAGYPIPWLSMAYNFGR